MMDPPSGSAPHDIGPTVAVVGTEGWLCCLCHTSFQRTFSIEHHMIMNHHPLPQQVASAPTPRDNAALSLQNDCRASQGQGDLLRRSDIADNLDQADSQGQVGHSNENSSDGAVTGGVYASLSRSHTVTESCNNAEAQDSERSCQMQEGNVVVKVETSKDCSPSSVSPSRSLPPMAVSGTIGRPLVQGRSDGGRSMDQSLPMFFPATQSQILPNQDASGSGSADSPEAKAAKMQYCAQSSIAAGVQGGHVSVSSSVSTETQNYTSCVAANNRRKDNRRMKPYKRRICSCGEVFETKPDFKHHRRVVHCRLNRKVFICPICGSQYSYKQGLNRHIKEKGSISVPCGDCPQQFHDQLSLEAHKKNYHNAADSKVHDSRPLVIDEGVTVRECRDTPHCRHEANAHHQMRDSDPWECSKCKQHFFEKCAFRKHLRQCHILRNESGQPMFYCNLCSATFQWLVPFYRHYVNTHKLPSLADSAHFSPLLGNSPVPSPAPSVTTEINTAMAGVDLNHSSAVGGSSPYTSTIDLTSDHSLGLGMSEVCRNGEDEGSGRGSNPQSLASFTSTSEQASADDVVIVSDREDGRQSDSSTDSDSDWEVVSDPDGEKKQEARNREWEPRGPHRGRGCSFGMHPPFRHPPPPPPPPHFHPGHPLHPPPLPPPPPFSDDHDHAPPHAFGHPPPHPHHHRHHHHHHHTQQQGRGFGHWGFSRGRGARCSWGMPGSARFGPPGWFSDGDCSEHSASHPHTQPANNTASSPATGNTTQLGSSGTDTTSANPVTGPPDASESSQGAGEWGELGNWESFSDSAQFMAWAGKLTDNKRAKKMQKRVFFFIFRNCLQTRTFSVSCPECLQVFSEESELHTHTQEKHPASTQAHHYVCLICWQSFNDAVLYNKHIHQHCREFIQSRGPGRGRGQWMMGPGRGMRRLFKMVHKTLSPYGWNMPHFMRGHPLWESDKDSNDSGDSHVEDFKECPVCFKKFRANSRENFFERHVNAHYGVDTYNFKCEECGKTFLEKAKFTAHQLTHSTALYVCDVCEKTYQSKTSLTRHQRTHTGERPYKCADCGEGFIENRDLVRHRTVHTGQAAFKCQECGAGFTLKTSLQNHMKKQHPVPSLSELGQHQKTGSGGHGELQAGDSVKEEPASMELD